MLHLGLIVKQGLIVKLAIFIDSKTQFYVSFRCKCQIRPFYRHGDPILCFIPVYIETETHSCVLKTARPNYMFHSGLIVKQGLFIKTERPNFMFHSGTEMKIGSRETQITERPYGTFTCRPFFAKAKT
jgi:hypothetical protein